MVDGAAVSVGINLLATGITFGTDVSASKARAVLRRRRFSEEVEDIATEFTSALKRSIETVDTSELGVQLEDIDDWEAVATELARRSEQTSEPTGDPRERDQLSYLFSDEEKAITEIAEAIAAAKGFDLSSTPQVKSEYEAAVARAYTQTISTFERRIAGTDLADVFEQELQLTLVEQLDSFRDRLQSLVEDVGTLLSKEIRNEGFVQLSDAYFERVEPAPETSWRTTFTLADVFADIPAKRDGQGGTQTADRELLTSLIHGRNRIVVGRAGAGKSTVCKQVAIEWYRDESTGTVLYRDSDEASRPFQSRGDLQRAIAQSEGHLLVVVEDAVRAEANAIFRTIEEHTNVTDVTFLLDVRESELTRDPSAETLDSGSRRRYQAVIDHLEPYHLPDISEAEVERVVASFEETADIEVPQAAEALYEKIQAEQEEGVGGLLLLSFYLPLGDEALEPETNKTGIEAHARSRYLTVTQPGSDGALRDLSEFDSELLTDVGVMVNLLNSAGLGIYPELVHALGERAGHEISIHDEIAEIRAALEGWFLFPVSGTSDGQVRTTHELWSTLFLREVAQHYTRRQAARRRRARSEPHTGRCLDALFKLFEDESHREALFREFPDSAILTAIERDPESEANEYLRAIFELLERWPGLAPLMGTSRSARYDLPDCCSEQIRQWVVHRRGDAYRRHGSLSKAQREYEQYQSISDDPRTEAQGLDSLGQVAWRRGEYEDAWDYHRESLEMYRELNDTAGEATALRNLGRLARSRSDYDHARRLFEESLQLVRELSDELSEAKCLNNLGLIARMQGEYSSAREYHQAGLDIYLDYGNRVGQSACYNNLGLVAWAEGQCELSREYHKQSLELDRKLGNRAGEANSLGNLGLLARIEGEYQTAHRYHEHSFEIDEEIDNRTGQANSLNNRGLVFLLQGDYESAEESLESALDMYRELADPREVECLNNLGKVAYAQGKHQAARTYLQDGLELARENADDAGIAESWQYLGLLRKRAGKSQQARAYLQRSHGKSALIGDDIGAAAAREGLAKVDLETGNLERARERFASCLDVFTDIGTEHRKARNRALLGAVQIRTDSVSEGRDRLRQARQTLRDCGAVPDELQILHHHLQAELAVGHHSRARELCREAMARVDATDASRDYHRTQIETIAEDRL